MNATKVIVTRAVASETLTRRERTGSCRTRDREAPANSQHRWMMHDHHAEQCRLDDRVEAMIVSNDGACPRTRRRSRDTPWDWRSPTGSHRRTRGGHMRPPAFQRRSSGDPERQVEKISGGNAPSTRAPCGIDSTRATTPTATASSTRRADDKTARVVQRPSDTEGGADRGDADRRRTRTAHDRPRTPAAAP